MCKTPQIVHTIRTLGAMAARRQEGQLTVEQMAFLEQMFPKNYNPVTGCQE